MKDRAKSVGKRRFISGIGSEDMARYGVRLGDIIEYFPQEGRSKIIKINRTKLNFKTVRGDQQLNSSYQYDLPGFQCHSYNFTLDLVYNEKKKDDQEGARYKLRSDCRFPFKINGITSFESFIERGDRILIGYNVLKFIDQGRDNENNNDPFEGIEKYKNIIKSDLNILLEGETGTGKSHLAKKMHILSGKIGKFVQINIASFSSTLVESELFGHTKGAFTGAIEDKRGAILEANKGTLFLDEIDSLSIEIQTKLLLFLDSKEVRPVGGSKSIKCYPRIIFASGSDLKKRVVQKQMRKDFYFRISSGQQIQIIPLREDPKRLESISNDFARDNNIEISKSLVDYYKTFPWPGNIRQLISHLEKKRVMTRGNKLFFDQMDDELLVLSSDLSVLSTNEITGYYMPMSLCKEVIAKRAYFHCHKNIKTTSKVLKIGPDVLRNLLRNQNIAI